VKPVKNSGVAELRAMLAASSDRVIELLAVLTTAESARAEAELKRDEARDHWIANADEVRKEWERAEKAEAHNTLLLTELRNARYWIAAALVPAPRVRKGLLSNIDAAIRLAAPLPEKPLCISCGEPATEKAGKGGGTGSDLCARCWRDEFSDPGADHGE
jgi:hypothetical protein